MLARKGLEKDYLGMDQQEQENLFNAICLLFRLEQMMHEKVAK